MVWLTKILTTAMVALIGLLPSSCTTAKKVAAQHAPVAETTSGSATNKNLGDLSLTNHYETCVRLGPGKSCTIKPTLLDHSNLQLTMAVESKSANGKTKDFSVVQVMAKAGKPFEVAVGEMNFTFTPRMVE